MKTLRMTLCLCLSLMMVQLSAQSTSNHGNKFEQLGNLLRSPNAYRAVDGAPGPNYWQQRADYEIECTLDTEKLRLDGKEKITYYNNSPNTLSYLWLQLDENQHAPHVDNQRFNSSSIQAVMDEGSIDRLEPWRNLDGYGNQIQSVIDDNGKPMKYTINQTMMRIDLAEDLNPGEEISFHIEWYYNIINRVGGPGSSARGGYEYFEDSDDYIFTITQWYPRMCVYSDFEGWQNKQFTGRGEFALIFGDFEVKMTVPDDYVVGSTGECLNYKDVLSEEHYNLYKKSEESDVPVEIVTLNEALKKEKKKKRSENMQTWIYQADDVRDFAWTASRKFVWDAMAVQNEDGKKIMCMSYYPKESYPIYNKYSTKVVAHTLETYSRFSIPYPYPVAISVEAANGMEYPMICFNPGRAEEDGTYSEAAKNRAILVIIHEVGHNYFPMIINSDERQWTWFDEGINTFMQYLTEATFDNNFDHGRGPAHLITDYMRLPKDQLEPIMTNSENIVRFGANAYAKPATALNILRETIMGRELFDFAFKEYCKRWAFKHPTPADFFRTMEDASGVDLDWFWRGWFYGIDAVDIALDTVVWYKVDLENNPEKRPYEYAVPYEKPFEDISKIRNRDEGIKFKVEEDESLQDFYTFYKPWEEGDSMKMSLTLYDETLTEEEKKQKYGDKNFYELHFSNVGGLVMPVIIEWTFDDGTKEVDRIPAEVWRKNEDTFKKVFIKTKEVKSIVIDPMKETADINEANNQWPIREMPSRFQVFKAHKQNKTENPMQRSKKKKKGKPGIGME